MGWKELSADSIEFYYIRNNKISDWLKNINKDSHSRAQKKVSSHTIKESIIDAIPQFIEQVEDDQIDTVMGISWALRILRQITNKRYARNALKQMKYIVDEICDAFDKPSSE